MIFPRSQRAPVGNRLFTIFAAFLWLTVAFEVRLPAQPFAHPGALHTQADFDRRNILINNSGASSNCVPQTQAGLQRGSGGAACGRDQIGIVPLPMAPTA